MPLHTNTELVLDTPEKLKAIADDNRSRILRILQDGPASAKELAGLTGMSHGKVGHHVKVLRQAGFIEVVDERPVRAVVERFYGLTYERLRFDVGGMNRLQFTLDQAAREASPDQPFEPPGFIFTVRMEESDAAEFHRRLVALGEEFNESEEPGASTVFGFTGAVFSTETPARRAS